MTAPALTCAYRLVRASGPRSLVLGAATAVPVGVAAASTVAGWSGHEAMWWIAAGLTVTVVATSLVSADPTAAATAAAWRHAGASPTRSHWPIRLAALLLSGTSVLVGLVLGSVIGLGWAVGRFPWGDLATLGATLIGLTVGTSLTVRAVAGESEPAVPSGSAGRHTDQAARVGVIAGLVVGGFILLVGRVPPRRVPGVHELSWPVPAGHRRRCGAPRCRRHRDSRHPLPDRPFAGASAEPIQTAAHRAATVLRCRPARCERGAGRDGHDRRLGRVRRSCGRHPRGGCGDHRRRAVAALLRHRGRRTARQSRGVPHCEAPPHQRGRARGHRRVDGRGSCCGGPGSFRERAGEPVSGHRSPPGTRPGAPAERAGTGQPRRNPRRHRRHSGRRR